MGLLWHHSNNYEFILSNQNVYGRRYSLNFLEFIFNKMKKKSLKIHKQKAVREQPLLHRKYFVGKIMKVDILHVLFLGIHHSIYNYILHISKFSGT